MISMKKFWRWLAGGDARQADEAILLWWALAVSLATACWVGLGGYFAGFGAAQAASQHWPPIVWECVTVLGDERVLLALGLPLPRPAALLPAEQILVIGGRVSRHCLPSGHTVSAFAFAGVWLAFLSRRRRLPLLALAGLAGFSRIAVGAHWPADVLLGAVVGLLAAWGGIKLARYLAWGTRDGVQRYLLLFVVLASATLPFDGQGYDNSLAFRLLVCGTAWLAAYRLHLPPAWKGRLKALGEPRPFAMKA